MSAPFSTSNVVANVTETVASESNLGPHTFVG